MPSYVFRRPRSSPVPPARHPQDSSESIQKRLLFLPDPACHPHESHEIMGVHRYRAGSCRWLRTRLRRSKSPEWCLIMPSGGYRCAQKWADPHVPQSRKLQGIGYIDVCVLSLFYINYQTIQSYNLMSHDMFLFLLTSVLCLTSISC